MTNYFNDLGDIVINRLPEPTRSLMRAWIREDEFGLTRETPEDGHTVSLEIYASMLEWVGVRTMLRDRPS